MNINYYFQRLIGRKTCILARGAKLDSSAKIRNMQDKSAYIQIGGCSFISGELLIFAHGGKIEIGEWCYVGEGSRIWSADSIRIGDRVLISHNVNIFDSNTHPISASLRHKQFRDILTSGHPSSIRLSANKVILENDVWVGAGANILRGVTIGSQSIVAIGSVVTKNVPPNVIVAGNPARIIRELSEDERR